MTTAQNNSNSTPSTINAELDSAAAADRRKTARLQLLEVYKTIAFVNRLLDHVEEAFPELRRGTTPLQLAPIRSALLRLDRQGVSEEHFVLDVSNLRALLQVAGRELARREAQVGARRLRLFLARVGATDRKILCTLLKFYRLTASGSGPDPELTDKVDFVLTSLGRSLETLELTVFLVVLKDLREQGCSVEDEVIDSALESIRSFEGQATKIEAISDLDDRRTIDAYRCFKHGLGELLFHPRVASAIVRTNLLFTRILDPLLHRSTDALRSAYEAGVAAHGRFPPDLEKQSESLRDEIARLEDDRRSRSVKARTVVEVRARLNHFMLRLAGPRPSREVETQPAPLAIENEPQQTWVLDLAGRQNGPTAPRDECFPVRPVQDALRHLEC